MCHFSRTSLYVDKGGIFISNETHKRRNRDNNGMLGYVFANAGIRRLSSRSPKSTNEPQKKQSEQEFVKNELNEHNR